MVSDLIYCGHKQYKQCQEEIKAAFPSVVFEDGSDEIHGGRFSFEVDAEEREVDLFLLRNGYFDISLRLGFLKLSESKQKREYLGKLVKQVIAEKESHNRVEVRDAKKKK